MNELIGQLISKVGVTQDQAEGGLGAILNLAKESMGGEGFAKITESLGGTDELLKKFSSLSSSSSEEGGFNIGGLLSSATSALGVKNELGGIAGMVSTLSALNIDLDTIKKFAPVVTDFLDEKGLGDISEKIKSLL